MKYYGFGYKGEIGKYDVEDLHAYDSPYQALLEASRKWDNAPDPYERRLLVVLGSIDSKNAGEKSNQYAFFQFTDAESCMDFIKSQKKIKWVDSSAPVSGYWNGNAHMME